MTIQASSARSALILAAALVLGVIGSAPAFATDWGTIPAPAMTSDTAAASSDGSAPATPATEMQAAPMAQPADAGGATDNAAVAASAPAEDAPASVAAVSNDDSSGWDKASIVGKIFIACGTLLTLGSAARMFML